MLAVRAFIRFDGQRSGGFSVSRLCGRRLRNAISGDEYALNVRFRTEISAKRGAPCLRRRSTNRTFEIERRVIEAHLTLVPPPGQISPVKFERRAARKEAYDPRAKGGEQSGESGGRFSTAP